ncbi:RDD family protein [Sporosarcina siberiensis]|uniref:RDD family protein n=1 Tax=Sporosarcina siberiensis TaxID=1365606 RepID=A0ABW4SGP7_9BACL
MIGKRITAHILNRVIIFFPSMILLGGVTLLIFPSYFIFGNDESGWLIFWLLKYMICLPTVFIDLVSRPFEFLKVIEIILPALISLIIIEIISITLIKRDLGMKVMGLKIVSIKEKPLSLIQIIVRTVIKYFSLSFFPFVLVYLFLNKDKITLHDKISYTKVVKIQK